MYPVGSFSWILVVQGWEKTSISILTGLQSKCVEHFLHFGPGIAKMSVIHQLITGAPYDVILLSVIFQSKQTKYYGAPRMERERATPLRTAWFHRTG